MKSYFLQATNSMFENEISTYEFVVSEKNQRVSLLRYYNGKPVEWPFYMSMPDRKDSRMITMETQYDLSMARKIWKWLKTQDFKQIDGLTIKQ